MAEQRISVVCVQVRDDEQTERFVVISSPFSHLKDIRCSELLMESAARAELAVMGLERDELESRIQSARAFKTTTTSETLMADWTRALRRTAS